MPCPRDQEKIWNNLALVEEDQRILRQTGHMYFHGP